jgi:segregation and condensation protein B
MSAPAIVAKVEAILFSSTQPLAVKAIAKAAGESVEAVEKAITGLTERYESKDSGVRLLQHDGRIQLVTAPNCEPVVGALQREELEGELTKPSIETLSVIAYRGPISKPELEQIRGVNCSLIIRNLLLRGLVEEQQRPEFPLPVYVVSFDFLRHLGVQKLEDLPNYKELRSDPALDEYLRRRSAERPTTPPA